MLKIFKECSVLGTTVFLFYIFCLKIWKYYDISTYPRSFNSINLKCAYLSCFYPIFPFIHWVPCTHINKDLFQLLLLPFEGYPCLQGISSVKDYRKARVTLCAFCRFPQIEFTSSIRPCSRRK